jgi:hypothetical protein
LDSDVVTPEEPICRTGNWQDKLKTDCTGIDDCILVPSSFEDTCYDVNTGTVTPSVTDPNALCDGSDFVTIRYSFEYERDDEACPALATCSYGLQIECTDDTAYGYRQEGEDAGTLWKHREDGWSNRWAWGEYFPVGAPSS